MIKGICSPHLTEEVTSLQSMKRRGCLLLACLLMVISWCQIATAEPTALEIRFKDANGKLVFDLDGVQKGQVSLKLNDEANSLVKVVIDQASIPTKKYWIRKFKESKSDPDVKGIMVRRLDQDKVEIRVRYRRRISPSQLKQISITSSSSGVSVSASRKLGDLGEKKSVVSSTPKPTLDPKLNRIREISSSLNEESNDKPSVDAKAKTRSPANNSNESSKSVSSPKTSQALASRSSRPPVFERGTPIAPLPKLDPIRPTSQSATSTLSSTTTNAVSPITVKTLTGSASPAPLEPVDDKLLGSGNARKKRATDSEQKSMSDQPQSSLEGFNLDELTQLVAYLLVFVLLMFLARIFLKRGKETAKDQMDHSVKVVSQKVVNLNPRQRVMVIEVKGHTLVIGACDRNGLSHLAHLSTPLGPVGGGSSQGSLGGGLDALNQLSDGAYADPAYYADDRYVRGDMGYSRSHSDLGQPAGFEESTFVGNEDEEGFTVDVPIVSTDLSHERDRMSEVDSYAMGETPRALATPASAQVTHPPSALGEDAEDEVKPENLLQLIQKLNSSKS